MIPRCYLLLCSYFYFFKELLFKLFHVTAEGRSPLEGLVLHVLVFVTIAQLVCVEVVCSSRFQMAAKLL